MASDRKKGRVVQCAVCIVVGACFVALASTYLARVTAWAVGTCGAVLACTGLVGCCLTLVAGGRGTSGGAAR